MTPAKSSSLMHPAGGRAGDSCGIDRPHGRCCPVGRLTLVPPCAESLVLEMTLEQSRPATYGRSARSAVAPRTPGTAGPATCIVTTCLCAPASVRSRCQALELAAMRGSLRRHPVPRLGVCAGRVEEHGGIRCDQGRGRPMAPRDVGGSGSPTGRQPRASTGAPHRSSDCSMV